MELTWRQINRLGKTIRKNDVLKEEKIEMPDISKMELIVEKEVNDNDKLIIANDADYTWYIAMTNYTSDFHWITKYGYGWKCKKEYTAELI